MRGVVAEGGVCTREACPERGRRGARAHIIIRFCTREDARACMRAA